MSAFGTRPIDGFVPTLLFRQPVGRLNLSPVSIRLRAPVLVMLSVTPLVLCFSKCIQDWENVLTSIDETHRSSPVVPAE